MSAGQSFSNDYIRNKSRILPRKLLATHKLQQAGKIFSTTRIVSQQSTGTPLRSDARGRREVPYEGKVANSKHEARNPKQIQNTNEPNDPNAKPAASRFEPLDFWPSDLFRISSVGFRISSRNCRARRRPIIAAVVCVAFVVVAAALVR